MGEPNDDPPPAVVVESIYETMAIQNVVLLGDGRYDCEVEHPEFGWMPFTADANDPEVGARRIYERIVAEL